MAITKIKAKYDPSKVLPWYACSHPQEARYVCDCGLTDFCAQCQFGRDGMPHKDGCTGATHIATPLDKDEE